MSIIQEYVNAWNNHDSHGIEACFLSDGVYIDANLDHEIPAYQFALRTQELFTSFPNLNVSVSQPIESADGLFALQWELSGAVPDKTLRGMDMLCVRDGRLQSVQVYFDYQTGLIFSKVPSLHLNYQPSNKPRDVQSVQINDIEPIKYRTSALTQLESEDIKQKLADLMTNKQYYLHSDLSLSQLASELGISTNHLSQVINSQFGCHFYDFVNRYRIVHSQQILKATNTPVKALVLALDSGFRSTSTFYAAFKKFTGMSLAEYKQSIKDSVN